MYLDSASLDGDSSAWAAGSPLASEPIDWTPIDEHFALPSERAVLQGPAAPLVPERIETAESWPLLAAARDIVGKSLGLIPDPFCLQAGRDFVDPEVPAWAKPGALFVKGTCDLRDVGTSLIVKPLADLAHLGPLAMGALRDAWTETTAEQLMGLAVLKLVDDGPGALLSGAGDTAAAAGRALRDTAVDVASAFAGHVGSELAGERPGLGVGTLLGVAPLGAKPFQALVFGGSKGLSAATIAEERLAVPGRQVVVHGVPISHGDEVPLWTTPKTSEFDDIAKGVAKELARGGVWMKDVDLVVGLSGTVHTALPLSAKYGKPAAIVDEGPRYFETLDADFAELGIDRRSTGRLRTSLLDFYAQGNPILWAVPGGQRLGKDIDAALANVMSLPEGHPHPDGAMWDQLNRVLAQAVQPDGRTLRLDREVQAGRMPLDEYADLLRYAPADLERFAAGDASRSLQAMHAAGLRFDDPERALGALQRLEDEGAVRFGIDGSVDFLGREYIGGELRSVKHLSFSGRPGERSTLTGLDDYRPVLPGSSGTVFIESDPVQALRTHIDMGHTVVIDDFTTGRWANHLGSGPFVSQARSVSIPNLDPSRWAKGQSKAWDLQVKRMDSDRYQEMLRLLAPGPVQIR